MSADLALNPADRCMCPESTDANTSTVAFPTGGDTYSGSSTTRLAVAGDRLGGTHPLPYSRIAGVAMETRLLNNNLTADSRCVNTTATFDLLINNRAVHAFAITPRTPTTVPLRVAYQTFAPITVPTTGATIALRLRSISPAGCGSVEFDRTTLLNNLTVLGHNP
jgi:hypothetical protein